MVSRFTRSVPVTINDVLDGHVALDLQCLDRLYLHGYLAPAAGRRAGDPVPEPPRVPGAVPGVPAADRGRLPPPGRLLRRGQPHPGGDAEGRRPQHRGDAALPGQGRGHRPVAGRGDRGGPGAAAGAHRPPAPHRPGQVPAVLLRQEGPPGHGLLLLLVGRELRPGVHQDLHLLPVADEDLGQRARVGQAAGPQDRARLHRAVQRVRLLPRIPPCCRRSATRCSPAPSTCSSSGGCPGCRCRSVPPTSRPGTGGSCSMAQVEVSRTIVFTQPRHARAFFEALVTDNLDLGRPDTVEIVFGRRIRQRQAARHPGHVQDQGHHPRHRGHHQRLLPALPDQAVPQGRPGPAHRDRHQLAHRPADRPPPAQPGRTAGRRACDQRPAAAH